MLWPERMQRTVALHREGNRGSEWGVEGGPGAGRTDRMKDGLREVEMRQRGEGHRLLE